MNLNWTRRILAMVLCLCMLFGSSVLAEETVDAIVEATVETVEAPAAANLEEEEVAEEIDVAVEEAAEETAEEAVEETPEEAVEETAPIVVTPLAAAEVIPQEGWEMGDNNAYTIPYAAGTEEVTFTWAAIEGAVSYRIETAHISESGEPEGIQEIGVVEETSIALPVSSYSNGWYAMGIVAEAEDGRSSVCMQVFRLQEEVAEEEAAPVEEEEEVVEEEETAPVEEEEEVAEDVDVSVEATPLRIIEQPQSVTVAAGEMATVSVQAIGDGLTYTWYTREANDTTYYRSSITSNSYSVVMNAARNGRRLICYVGDQYGNKIQCNTVQIKMAANNPLRIIQQPQSQKVAEGQKTSVTVIASGDGLTYAWYMKDPGDTSYTKSSITSNTYATVMNATRDGRRLICYVYDIYGNSIQCNTVKISMGAPLVIVKQPQSQTVAAGQKTSVSVTATGDGLTYAWFMKDPGDTSYTKSSITTNTYATVMNATRNGRRLICYVYDAYGRSVQCNTVKISMASPLAIITQPQGVTVAQGQTASVTVQATGDGLTYAWYTKDAGASSYSLSSITSSTYSVTMSSACNGRRLICYVSDKYGNKVQSNTVVIKMLSSSAPGISAARTAEGSIKVTWNSVENAQGYYIYRSSTYSGTYSKIATVGSSVTSYTNSGLSSYYKYYYKVQAYANGGAALGTMSSYSGAYTSLCPNPTILSVSKTGNTTAQIKWKEMGGIEYYRVMRSTSSDFTTDYESYTIYPGSGTYAYFTDSGLSSGTYYYRMDARYEALNSGETFYTVGYSSTYTYTHTGSSSTTGGDGVVEYRAFLIGNLYPGTVNELPGPDNDVDAMGYMLARQTASDYDIWTGENLYASTILSGITQVFGEADEDDVSLFYYSGHGTSSGSLVGVDGYYVTVSSLRNKLDTIKGKKIVLLDSCYSGAHINKTYGDGKIDYSAFNDAVVSKFAEKDKTLTTNDYVVITACSKTQTSSSLGYYDSSIGDYFYFGGFTYGVTKGSGFEMLDWEYCSRYADTNSNGKLTLAEVYNYAYSQAKNLGLSQNAQYYGDTSFVLWKY